MADARTDDLIVAAELEGEVGWSAELQLGAWIASSETRRAGALRSDHLLRPIFKLRRVCGQTVRRRIADESVERKACDGLWQPDLPVGLEPSLKWFHGFVPNGFQLRFGDGDLGFERDRFDG